MTKHWPLLVSIVFILLFSVATSILNAFEIQTIKDELKQPKRLEMINNGAIVSVPLGANYRLVDDK